jgi:hypothetical protein
MILTMGRAAAAGGAALLGMVLDDEIGLPGGADPFT